MPNTKGPDVAEPKRVALSEFLDGLDSDAAEAAQTAADEIDALENRAKKVNGIERQLEPVFYLAVLAFIVGACRFVGGEDFMFGLLGWIDGLGISLLLGALPALGFYYAFKVRWRTRADAKSFELNQSHFMPHGGIYFPATEPEDNASVVLIDQSAGYKPRPSKYDKVKPGWMW